MAPAQNHTIAHRAAHLAISWDEGLIDALYFDIIRGTCSKQLEDLQAAQNVVAACTTLLAQGRLTKGWTAQSHILLFALTGNLQHLQMAEAVVGELDQIVRNTGYGKSELEDLRVQVLELRNQHARSCRKDYQAVRFPSSVLGAGLGDAWPARDDSLLVDPSAHFERLNLPPTPSPSPSRLGTHRPRTPTVIPESKNLSKSPTKKPASVSSPSLNLSAQKLRRPSTEGPNYSRATKAFEARRAAVPSEGVISKKKNALQTDFDSLRGRRSASEAPRSPSVSSVRSVKTVGGKTASQTAKKNTQANRGMSVPQRLHLIKASLLKGLNIP